MPELKALLACLKELKQARRSIRKALDDLDAPEERTATRKAREIRDRITRELTKLSLTRPETPAYGKAVERLDRLPDRLFIDDVDMLIQVVEAALEASVPTKKDESEMAPGVKEDAQGGAPRTRRTRGRGVELSRRRIEMLEQLQGELAWVAIEQQTYTTLDTLKEKFPEFRIW